jgi:pimeloyl-ACP methyl ester carboxylesterase
MAPSTTRSGTGAAGSGEPSGFRDRWVERGPHRIRVRERDGEDPAILLMHGFPDNHHLYDRLVPHVRNRHVGCSTFSAGANPTSRSVTTTRSRTKRGDVGAVITGLGLDRVILVPHDASGPAAINWALEHPERVAAIVALNTFYSLPPDVPLNPPEAIRLFSDPAFALLTEHFADSHGEFRWLYEWQVGRFIRNDEVREKFVPLLYRQFEVRPSSIEAFMKLNADLNPAVLADTERASQLQSFPAPVRTVFGQHDAYLTPEQGRSLAALFPRAEALSVAKAGHFPQLDAPAEVAELIQTVPLAEGSHGR